MVKLDGKTHWFQVLLPLTQFVSSCNATTCGTTKGLLRRSSVLASAGRSRCNLEVGIDFGTHFWHKIHEIHKKNHLWCNQKLYNCGAKNLKHAILKHATRHTPHVLRKDPSWHGDELHWFKSQKNIMVKVNIFISSFHFDKTLEESTLPPFHAFPPFGLSEPRPRPAALPFPAPLGAWQIGGSSMGQGQWSLRSTPKILIATELNWL